MVGVGELSERVLFFITSETFSDSKKTDSVNIKISGEDHED